MSASNSAQKVLLVGPHSYVGGVSVHMKRLAHILEKDFDVGILDDAPAHVSGDAHNIRVLRQLPENLQYIWSHDIIHIHTGNWMLRVGMILLSMVMRKKIIVTMHSYRLTGIPRAITQLLLRLADHVICVNEIIFRLVVSRSKFLKEAFIPPVESGCGLPEALEQFIRDNDGRSILCANAFRLSEYQGDDLYGLNQCIEVARLARDKHESIVIVFVVGRVDPSDRLYFKAANEISCHDLSGYIHVIPYSVDFIELIRRSDVVLRPTLTDGDALTVREALFLGKPVVASDVVSRPDGTYLYRAGDAFDLYRVIKKVLSGEASGDSFSASSSVGEMEEYRNFYARIYRMCVAH